MKIKPILSITLAVLALSFFACDDDVRQIGGSIQPGGDLVGLGTDTFDITAKTIVWDSIYARTTNGLVGEYDDPVFGKIKSDYLTEFFCGKELDFKSKKAEIDSMDITVVISGYIGDSLSPMGLSVYKTNKELDRNFYTNIDPTKYCDMRSVLGRNIFTLEGVNTAKGMTPIKIKVDNSIAQTFYSKWLEDPSIFHDPDSLKTFLPGIYVTQTLGNGALIDVYRTELNIHYNYKGPNYNKTRDDSTYKDIFYLSSTPEVMQMNHVQNKNMNNLLTEGDPKRTYFKTPAGVYTELNIPLSEIAKVVKKDTLINSAKLYLKGFTEEEQHSTFGRPNKMLLINKDSIHDFFRLKKLPDNTTSFIINRNINTNVYDFTVGIMQYNNLPQGFIPKMLNHYLKKFREGGQTSVPDLKYVLIPVHVDATPVTSSNGSVSYTFNSISNLMRPTSAIIRTDEDNMKLPIVFSKYKDR